MSRSRGARRRRRVDSLGKRRVKRLRLGRLRQQAQDRQADQEAIRSRPPTEAERGAKRVALRAGRGEV
jgi:hypothetical protein